MTPFTRKVETNIYTLPCGKCPYCFKRRVSNWSFRLIQEDKNSLSSLFITLTYDNKNIPLTMSNYMTLRKRDIQLFMKRLRKVNKMKLKYYLCGEYGGKTMRPHYHIILFNADIKTIQPAWNLGQVHYGKVSEASVGYTLKYISKETKIPVHKNDDRLKEFSLMSKGLGKNYLTDSMIRWHKEDLINRMYCNLNDGKKISMPRYYKDKMYNYEERGILKAHHTEKITKELELLAYDNNLNKIIRERKESIKNEFKRLNINQDKRNKL